MIQELFCFFSHFVTMWESTASPLFTRC